MTAPPRALPVTTAAQAAARDRAAIAAGAPSFDLMLRAGTAAAAEILRRFPDRLYHGVALHAGPGNNGGDAYIVAAQLARAGVAARLSAAAPPRTDDATRAAALAADRLVHGAPTGHELLVVDGLLGTGHRGALRDPILAHCTQLSHARDRGAAIVALDLPSGLDANEGTIAPGSVPAALTVSFGTLKRGHVIARAHVGHVRVVDIGLDGHAWLDDEAWMLADARALAAHVPPISWDTYKSRRGAVGIVGGAAGMAGAVVLAAQAALRAGAGLVHAFVDTPSVAVLQGAVPQALAHARDAARVAREMRGDGNDTTLPALDAIAIGPGFGRDAQARALLEDWLGAADRTPLVLDADALTLVATMASERNLAAADLLASHAAAARPIVCTPHLGEFARLVRGDYPDGLPPSLGERVDIARSFAIRSRATLLLKGTPTVVCAPDGAPPLVVPRGSAVLATGGSGDLLTGIVATLLAQGTTPVFAAAIAAWVHGRAAELVCESDDSVRGRTLSDVLDALPAAWRELQVAPVSASARPDVIASLPAVGPS